MQREILVERATSKKVGVGENKIKTGDSGLKERISDKGGGMVI